MILWRIVVFALSTSILGVGVSAFAADIASDRIASVSTKISKDVNDVANLPFLTPEGKDAYKWWTTTGYNRAFAISPNGGWGMYPEESDRSRLPSNSGAPSLNAPLVFVIQDAMERCEKKSGDKCFIYAQNGTVAWDGSVPQLTKVAENADTADEISRLKAALAKAEEDNRLRDATAKVEADRSKRETPSVKLTSRAAQRRALIFGNDSYQYVPTLKNARADAKAMSKALASLGYSVSTYLDVNERDMKKAIRDFTRGVAGGDEVLFFYAGHGVQIGSANYLLPVDLRAEDAAAVRDEAVPLQRVLDDLSEVKAKLTLAVIDACRDNPFKVAGRAIGGRGLAPTSAATGQMVMFSAGAGQQALDNVGANDKSPNGLFTRIFLKHLQKKGVTVDRIMRDVRSEVVAIAESVGHEQVPAIYDQVVGDFYFAQ